MSWQKRPGRQAPQPRDSSSAEADQRKTKGHRGNSQQVMPAHHKSTRCGCETPRGAKKGAEEVRIQQAHAHTRQHSGGALPSPADEPPVYCPQGAARHGARSALLGAGQPRHTCRRGGPARHPLVHLTAKQRPTSSAAKCSSNRTYSNAGERWGRQTGKEKRMVHRAHGPAG